MPAFPVSEVRKAEISVFRTSETEQIHSLPPCRVWEKYPGHFNATHSIFNEQTLETGGAGSAHTFRHCLE